MSTYEISKSSLLSLKAEILRKQDELSKIKSENQTKLKELKKQQVPLEVKNKGVEQRSQNDLSEQEQDLLSQSRQALEAKAKLYDQLSKTKQKDLTEEEIEFNRRYLVRFDAKARNNHVPPEFDEDDVDKYPEDEADTTPMQSSYPATNKDEEWVEYVDCFGRTRTCMRKDLDYIKSKDRDLEDVARQRNTDNSSPKEPARERSVSPELSEENELLSSDMRREILRRQWEKEEEELRNKSNIHYQDILFNEARTHGVGYYGFSKDEEERSKQQEALNKIREDTKQQQKRAQDLKAQREKALAARIKAAKRRKRERLGLPAEEDEPEPEPEKQIEQVEEKKDDEKEKEREELRKKHIRPWDRHKKSSSHYEYSQEEWVDKKRKERPEEFAPPTAYKRDYHSATLKIDSDDKRHSLKFTTKKHKAEESTTRSFSQLAENVRMSEPIPIVNELEEEEADSLMADYKLISEIRKTEKRGQGAEVPPPATFDYYGPTSSTSKKVKNNTKNENIGDSIEAGLKFLRQQIEKKQQKGMNRDDIF